MGKTFPVQLEQDDGGSPTLPSITLVGLPEWDQLALRHWGLEERAKALDLYAKVAKAITRAFEKWQRLIEERHAQTRVIETAQTRPDYLVAAPSYLWSVAGHFITAPILSPDPDSMVDGKIGWTAREDVA